MDDRHTFWKHEPVGLGDGNQPISHALKTSREKLPIGYKFGNLDRNIDLEDLYMLIRSHYLGSREENIYLGYTREFLEWQLDALKDTPEYACVLKFKEGEDFPEKIVGFIYGREQSMMICGSEVKLLGVNYLCLHTDHRSLGLAPALIKEITRRAHCRNITVAIFTGARTFDFSFCCLQYFHRPVNIPKLVDLNFIPAYMDRYGRFRVSEQKRRMRLMREEDVDRLVAIYSKEHSSYDIYEKMGRDAFLHNFLPRKDVVYTYVVDEDVVKEFVSFFIIDTLYTSDTTPIRTAYLHYYASPEPERLVEDLVCVLKGLGIDLLNILNMGRNKEIVKSPAYLSGTGHLNYSFYNFRIRKIDPGRLFFIMH